MGHFLTGFTANFTPHFLHLDISPQKSVFFFKFYRIFKIVTYTMYIDLWDLGNSIHVWYIYTSGVYNTLKPCEFCGHSHTFDKLVEGFYMAANISAISAGNTCFCVVMHNFYPYQYRLRLLKLTNTVLILNFNSAALPWCLTYSLSLVNVYIGI